MPLPIEIVQPAGPIALVLAVVLLAPFLAERLRLPGFVGIALAGMLFGPYALGLLPQGPSFAFLGKIGLLFLFFTAGVEMDLDRNEREPRAKALVSLLGFILPILAGLAIGAALLGLGFLPSLLLGCVFAGSALVAQPITIRLGLGRQRSVAASLASAALVTSLALLVSALAARLSLGLGDAGSALRLGGGIALWAAASVVVLPFATSLFFKRIKPDGTIEFAFVLAAGFACAYAAESVGIEAPFGAFLAGLLLNRFIPDSGALMNRLRFVGDTLLAPLFLLFAGSLADPLASFGRPSGLLEAGLIVAGSIAAKSIAAAAAGALLGYSRTEGAMLLALSVKHAAISLGIAFIGFELGLFPRSIIGSVLLMLAASGLIGQLLAGSAAKRLAAESGGQEASRSRPPSRVLIALSRPSSIRGLIDLSIHFRERGSDAPIYPVAVVTQSEASPEELVHAENLLAQAVVEGVAFAVPVFPSTRLSVNTADGILQAATDNRANIIVMGWHKAPRLSHSLYGSAIEQVILGSEALVVVARLLATAVAVDRSILIMPPLTERHPGFQGASSVLASFLKSTGSRLRVLTVRPNGEAAKAALSGVKAYGQVKLTELESWKDIPTAIRAQGRGRIAIFLFCVRPGEPAWHPGVEKLPQRLAEELGDIPLFLFYLPEQPEAARLHAVTGEGEGGENGPRGIFERALAARRVRSSLSTAAITDSIRELLRSDFEADRKTLSRLTGMFTDIAQKQPIELKPGIVLLHAHVSEVSESMVFFGARPEGFRILALERPAKIIILLCTPADQRPEDHLQALGEIAKLFKDNSIAERLGIPGEDAGTRPRE